MQNHDRKRIVWFLLLAAPIVISYLHYDLGLFQPSSPPSAYQAQYPILTQEAQQHILYGDGDSGGHRHSIGTPCKTEFPAYWDESKIFDIVQNIAANDNLDWRRESNGYDVAEQRYEGVEVRVVIDSQRNEIVTAYPTNLPRNPCP